MESVFSSTDVRVFFNLANVSEFFSGTSSYFFHGLLKSKYVVISIPTDLSFAEATLSLDHSDDLESSKVNL